MDGFTWPYDVIWSLSMPNKIKSFLWRAWHGILPAATNLRNGHVLINLQCAWCDEEVETLEHALLVCSDSQEVSNRSGYTHMRIG